LGLETDEEGRGVIGESFAMAQMFQENTDDTSFVGFFCRAYSQRWRYLFDTSEHPEIKKALIDRYYLVPFSDYISIFDENIENAILSKENPNMDEIRKRENKIQSLKEKIFLTEKKKEREQKRYYEDWDEQERNVQKHSDAIEDLKTDKKKQKKQIESLKSYTFSRSDIPLYQMLGIISASDRAFFIDKYTPDMAGYIQFLRDYFPFFFNILKKPISLKIPETELRKHAYITGRTGSGKTELLKSILYDKITQNRSAIVVLDPNGDFAKDIATFRHLNEQDRLVYIDPVAFTDAMPIFNPFEIADTSLDSIDVSAQTLTQSIRESVKEGRLSNQMEVLLYPVIATLLQKGNTDIKELQRFMDATSSDELYKFGLRSKFENHREFFRTQFDTRTYEITKASIKTRIQSLLNSYIFSRLIEGKSSFDLESLIEQRKVIVFNLAKGKMGTDASAAYGRLVLSALQAIAYRRVNRDPAKRVTTYIAIDEFQNYITPSIESILTEARKYGLHLIFASQVSGQNMDSSLKKIALSCTNIKIVGANSRTAHEEIAGEMGVHPNDLQTLGTGDFIAKIGNSPPVRFRGTSELVKKTDKHYITDREWHEILNTQKVRYYRDLTAKKDEEQTTETITNQNRKRKYDDGLRPDL
jgi:hypothetical protein